MTSAAVLVETWTDGTRSASATFEIVGGDLQVTLANTSLFDTMDPIQLLQGVFFGISGFDGELTRISAVLADSSAGAVIYPDAQNGTWTAGTDVVGGEWAYTNTVVGAPFGANNLITATGLNLVGPGDRFPGDNLAGPIPVNGMQYGIVSDGYTGGGNSAVTGQYALITTDVIFTLGGLPDGFTLDDLFGISFQYGTTFIPVVIPAPGATMLAAMGLGLVGLVRRRLG